jgi:hypothetical protein
MQSRERQFTALRGTLIIPTGEARRIDAPDPGHCPF